MESAEEFIGRYLREKADSDNLLYNTYTPLYKKYFTDDWAKYQSDFHAEMKLEELVGIEIDKQMARAITIQPYKDLENRYRYILCIVDGQWKISGREVQCFNCRGSGKRGDRKCSVCDGIGWKDYTRSTL